MTKQNLTLTGDANLAELPLKESEVNHLRQLLAWLRCEYYLDKDFQRGMISGAKAMVEMGKNSEEVSAMLQVNADKINKVPTYVRQAHKMLTKALAKHEKKEGVLDQEVPIAKDVAPDTENYFYVEGEKFFPPSREELIAFLDKANEELAEYTGEHSVSSPLMSKADSSEVSSQAKVQLSADAGDWKTELNASLSEEYSSAFTVQPNSPTNEEKLSALVFAAEKALQVLKMPCDRWNEDQTLKFNEAIDLLNAAIPKGYLKAENLDADLTENTEHWENGTYGTDERYVARAPAELDAKVNAALELQPK